MRYLITVLFCAFLFLMPFQEAFGQQRSESDDFSYALKLYNEKFYDLAAQQFSRFVNNYGYSNKVAEAGYYSGMSLYYLNQYENARREFQRVAVDFPKHDRAADSWYMIGECYQKLQNDEEAARSYEMVKLLHPQHEIAAESILKAGNIYQDLKNYEVAEQLYNLIQTRYLESTAYFPSILAQGRLYLERGQNSRAIEKLDKVLKSDGSNLLKAQAWFYLGESYYDQGNYQLAMPPYQTVIKTYQKTLVYPQAVLSLAKIYLQQEKYEPAQQLLNEGIQNNPPGLYLYAMNEYLADAYYLGGKFALAGKQYKTSSEDADSSRLILRKFKLALSLHQQTDIFGALETLRGLVLEAKYAGLPGFNQAKKFYFQWAFDAGKYEQGLSALFTLENRNSLSMEDLLWLTNFLKATADWNGIVRELQPMIYSENRFEQKDQFIFELGYAREMLQNYQASSELYEMLIRDFASSEMAVEAKKRLDYLYDYYQVDENVGIGRLALLIGDVINRKEEALLHFNLGKVYFESLKQYEQALEQFKMTIETTSDPSLHVAAYHFIGLTYQKMAYRENISAQSHDALMLKSKENLSKAMENLTAASDPDVIAWHFVLQGIEADKSSTSKQAGYYEMLVKTYPDSPLRENWFGALGKLYAQSDTTVSRALNYYNKVVSEFPASRNLPYYLYERALLYLKSDGSKAAEDFKTIARAYPHSYPAAKALFGLGLIWDADQNYSQSNQIYARVATDYYYTDLAAMAKLKMGDSFLYSKRSTEAVDVYKEALKTIELDDLVLTREFTSSRQAEISYKLGKAYFDLNNWKESRHYFISYLANNPTGNYRNDANYFLGVLYVTINDQVGAITSFEKVPASDMRYYTQSVRAVADIYFDMQEYTNAADKYKVLATFIEDPQQKADFQAREIVSLIRSGKKSTADQLISTFEKSYKSQTDHRASFQLEFGKYYRDSKNYDQAVRFFNAVKKNYPKSSFVDDADYFLALTYIAVNRHEDALDILTKFPNTYANSDNLGAVLNTLGGIYFRSEKYESAITSFRSALDKPLTPEVKRQVMSNLIKSYTFVNFWDAALALCRQYIETYPESEDVIDKKILMGRAYVSLNQVDRAVELFKETRLLADSEREPEIQFYIGDAYFQKGQYENAISEFVKIPLLSRKTKLQWEASALYYSGQAYEKLGRINDAKRMYAEIVKRPGIDEVLKKAAQKRIKEIEQ
ncbi:MAG: tetratricopeptide repeat protein [Calditrichales bacterium]|nr:MAG: tetratricopeptide repeat protein [Calditrichales bacterium]